MASKRNTASSTSTKTRTIKEKFLEERAIAQPPLVPLNEKQAQYLEYLKTKKLIIATGLPGASKTYLPTAFACDLWRSGDIDKIYLTRPNISNSKSLGFFGGDIVEKMSNWLLPVLDILHNRLGRAVVEIAIKNGDISFVPLEVIKGMSFAKRTFVICDEAEDITAAEAKTIVTRMGGCTMVLAGDIEQSALDERSGLAKLKSMVERNVNLQEYTGLVDFNRPSEIVRSPECKAWILAYRKEESKK